jgi:addiction module RelB/DinJ family antitoxin
MATIQIRVDDTTKKIADSLFGSLGLDTSTAVRMFLSAAISEGGLPFNVKKQKPIELHDGYGSYICEYGHVHDYSKLKLDDLGETIGPFDTVEELMQNLNNDD